MTIRHIVGWLVAVVLAVLVGSWSYAVANQKRAPAKALAAGAPVAGTAQAGLAFKSFVVRQAKKSDGIVSDTERRLVKDAYRAEPLAVNALGMLALSMTGEADARQRQSLLESAGKLSRRSALVSNELIKSAALRNDDRTFFAWLSRVMLTGGEAQRAYSLAMADATAKAGAVEALEPVIGPDPRWASDYWTLVVGRSHSLVNAAKLRLAIMGAPWRQTGIKPTDQSLLSGLVSIGELDMAQLLASGLGGEARRRNDANVLNSAGFAAIPTLQPFDWQLSATGNLGASIDSAKKRMVISAIGGAHGVAARKLIQLRPGAYALSWTLSSDAAFDPGTLTASIYCAEKGEESARLPVEMSIGKKQQFLTIANGDCRWHWIDLAVSMPDGGIGIDARIDQLSLVPTSAPAPRLKADESP